jgi:hypothetical protein
MPEFKENLEQVERLLNIAQIREEYKNCNNLYRFLGVDRTATQEKIKASIEEKYKFFLSKQNISAWETLTKAFISSRPAIEYIFSERKTEYDGHLIDLKVKELRKHFISLARANRELGLEEKKQLIKKGAEIGLSETQIVKIINLWMKEYGVKAGETSSSSASSSADAPQDKRPDKSYYEIFGIAADADYLEIKKIYDQEYRKYLSTKDNARWSQVSEAWETLKDRDKRKAYDKKIQVKHAAPVLKVICKKDGYYIYKDVKKGASFTETIVIKNDREGPLKGKIVSNADWLVPERENLLPEPEQTLEIQILSSKIPANIYDTKGTITIDTNGAPPYSIPFRVILEDLGIAASRFRKTYVPLTSACAGFIGSFINNSSFLSFLIIGIFAGVISYSLAKPIVKASLKRGLNIFKYPSTLIQGAAGSVAILAILSHSSVSSIMQKVEQEKLDITLRSEKPHVSLPPPPEPLQTLPEAENKQVIVDQVDHNQQSGSADDLITKETIALSGSLINVDSTTAGSDSIWRFGLEAMGDTKHYSFGCNNHNEPQFRVGANTVDWTTGTEAMKTYPDRVTLYLRSQDWDFVQKCSQEPSCDDQHTCPLAVVIEPNANAQNAQPQPTPAEASKSPSEDVKPNKALPKKVRIASDIAQKKKWKPKISSFAPPSRDNL